MEIGMPDPNLMIRGFQNIGKLNQRLREYACCTFPVKEDYSHIILGHLVAKVMGLALATGLICGILGGTGTAMLSFLTTLTLGTIYHVQKNAETKSDKITNTFKSFYQAVKNDGFDFYHTVGQLSARPIILILGVAEAVEKAANDAQKSKR